MAEAVVLVCDECGRPEATSITIRTGTGNYVKDLCRDHLSALLANTRAPRRGRPRTTSSSQARRSSGTTRRATGRSRTRAAAGRKRTNRKGASRKTAAAK